MQQLEALTRDAVALANGNVGAGLALSAPEAEVARQMQICNACRYCEGFCAVFPAMTRRLDFGKADIHFLANLCHNCGACLHACQYAPPHEFAVNVPQAMAKVRGQTYADYAWPRALGALYQRNGLTVSLALAAGLALFLVLALALNGRLWGGDLRGNFYNLFPHNLLVAMFAPVFLWAVLALGLGVRRFWREVKPATSGLPVSAPAAAEATHDVLRLKYLGGGHGEGCNNEDDAYTLSRRHAHHLTFYGFMLCFAATSLATVYHYAFGWVAPYDLPSLPKLLGSGGRCESVARHCLAIPAEPEARSPAWRRSAKTHGPRFHRAVVPDQPERSGAVAGAGNASSGDIAGDSSGYSHGTVCHASVWQVCSWNFPNRCTVTSRSGKTPAKSGRSGR